MYDRNLTIYSLSNALISKSMKIYPFLTKFEESEEFEFENDPRIMLKYENISKHELLKKESKSDHKFFIYF